MRADLFQTAVKGPGLSLQEPPFIWGLPPRAESWLNCKAPDPGQLGDLCRPLRLMIADAVFSGRKYFGRFSIDSRAGIA